MSCYYTNMDQRRILKRLDELEEQIVGMGEGRVDSESVNIALTMIDDMLVRSPQGEDLRSDLDNLRTLLRSVLNRHQKEE